MANEPVFSTAVPDQIVAPCPQKTTRPKAVHWIEIEMVGEDDQPIEGEEYRLVLPGGKVVRGYLDKKGWARVSNIEQGGTCVLTFPRLDQEAWNFVTSLPARPPDPE